MSAKMKRWLITVATVCLLAVLSFPVSLKKDRHFPYGIHEPELGGGPFAIAIIRLMFDGNKGLVDYLPGEVSLDLTKVVERQDPIVTQNELLEFDMPLSSVRRVWLQLQKKDVDRVEITIDKGNVFEAFRDVQVSRTATGVTWNGSTHDGNLVQLTARLPSTLIVMIAGPVGVITISPDVYSDNYLLRIEALEQASNTEQNNASSKRGIVIPDCKDALPMSNPNIVNAVLYLSSASQGKDAISNSLRETQIVNLNDSLARSEIDAQVKISDRWILDDKSAAFDELSSAVNCSSIDTLSNNPPKSVDSLQRMVRQSGYDVGFFVMRMDLKCDEKEAIDKQDGDEKGRQRNENAICGVAFDVNASDRERSGIALLDGQCFSDAGGLLAHEFGHLVGARHEIYNDHEGERGNHGTVAYVPKKGPKQACVVQDANGKPKIPGVDRCDVSRRHTATMDSSGYYSNRIPAFSSPAIKCNTLTVHEDVKANNSKFIREYLAALREPIVHPPTPTPTPQIQTPPPTSTLTPTLTSTPEVSGGGGLCEPFPRRRSMTCDSLRNEPSILFNIGTANYRDDTVAKSVIEQINRATKKVVVRGFSSQTGGREYNLGLSLRRATKVANDIRALYPEYEVAICAYGREFVDCFEGENDAMRAQINLVDW